MTYQRKNVKVRQMDGSFKWTTIAAKTKRELTHKIAVVQEDAEKRYQLSIQPLFADIADQWFDFHSREVSLYTANGYIAPLKDLKEEFGNPHSMKSNRLPYKAFLIIYATADWRGRL